MGKRAVIAFALVALTAPSFAATNRVSDVLYVLEMVDSTRQKTFQAVTLDQYHSLRTEAGLRNRFQPKALNQAKEKRKSHHSPCAQTALSCSPRSANYHPHANGNRLDRKHIGLPRMRRQRALRRRHRRVREVPERLSGA